MEYLLTDPRIDPGADKGEALAQACNLNSLDLAQLLLKDGRVNPGDNESSAFIAACRKGHFKLVQRFLKDPRVDPAAQGNAAIFAVCESDNHFLKTLQLLLDDPRVVMKQNSPSFTRRRHLSLLRMIKKPSSGKSRLQ